MITCILLAAGISLSLKHLFSSSADDTSGYVAEMFVSPDVDKNGDKIEDIFEEEIQRKLDDGNGSELVRVVVLLDEVPSKVHTSFLGEVNGSLVSELWRQAVKGFSVRMPYALISVFADLCPDLSF